MKGQQRTKWNLLLTVAIACMACAPDEFNDRTASQARDQIAKDEDDYSDLETFVQNRKIEFTTPNRERDGAHLSGEQVAVGVTYSRLRNSKHTTYFGPIAKEVQELFDAAPQDLNSWHDAGDRLDSTRQVTCARGTDTVPLLFLQFGVNKYYTTDSNEASALVRAGWQQKQLPDKAIFNCKMSLTATGSNTIEIYHLYRQSDGDRVYTSLPQVRNELLRAGYESHKSLGFGYGFGDMNGDGFVSDEDVREYNSGKGAMADVDENDTYDHLDKRLIVGRSRGFIGLPAVLGDLNGDFGIYRSDSIIANSTLQGKLTLNQGCPFGLSSGTSTIPTGNCSASVSKLRVFTSDVNLDGRFVKEEDLRALVEIRLNQTQTYPSPVSQDPFVGGSEFLGNPVRVKVGNNGTVNCSTFCQGSQWGGFAGTCIDAKRTSNKVSTSCDIIPGLGANLSCLCAEQEQFVKNGNNGTVSCETFCKGPQWGAVGTRCLSTDLSPRNSPQLLRMNIRNAPPCDQPLPNGKVMPTGTQVTCTCAK